MFSHHLKKKKPGEKKSVDLKDMNSVKDKVNSEVDLTTLWLCLVSVESSKFSTIQEVMSHCDIKMTCKWCNNGIQLRIQSSTDVLYPPDNCSCFQVWACDVLVIRHYCPTFFTTYLPQHNFDSVSNSWQTVILPLQAQPNSKPCLDLEVLFSLW